MIITRSAIDRRCVGPHGCGLLKSVDDFPYRTDPETDEITGYGKMCRSCDDRRWRSIRDKTPIVRVPVDDYGNSTVGAQPVVISHFTEAVRHEAIKQIKKDRSIATCADHIGVDSHTLNGWLSNHKEPYASWSRQFRAARDRVHKTPLVKAMTAEAKAGSVRAQEFLLRTGWKEEFGDTKEVAMTVRRGTDELDESNYTTAELSDLRRLLTKGQTE